MFEWMPRPGVRIFIELQFVKDRDYVLLNCQWSRKGRFPSEDLNGEIEEWAQSTQAKLVGADANLEGLIDRFPEGWLRLADFGRPSGRFEMAKPVPPLDRLEAAFSTPGGAALLQDAGIVDWKRSHEAVPYQSWTIVANLLELTEQDAQYALNGTIAELCGFVQQHQLPFLKSLARLL